MSPLVGSRSEEGGRGFDWVQNPSHPQPIPTKASRVRKEITPRQKPAIAVRRAGILARRYCAGNTASPDSASIDGSIAAVFTHSFHLRIGDAFVCVGEPVIGNGPLTLIIDADAPIAALGLQSGMPARVSVGRIRIGESHEFDLSRCALWQAPAWPVAAPAPQLADTCAALSPLIAQLMLRDGFAPFVFGAPPSATPFARAAAKALGRLQSWLARAFALGDWPASAMPTALAAVSGLLGLGPGLTPSGDDCLCGALAMLDAFGLHRLHAALASAVTQAAPGLTSPLSACLLRAAACGHVGEFPHRVVSAILSGDAAGAAVAAASIGHSSGWDMLAGAVMVTRIYVMFRASIVIRPPPLQSGLHPSWPGLRNGGSAAIP